MKKTTKTTAQEKPAKARKTQAQAHLKTKWFVLRGFKKASKDETGFLSINDPKKTREVYTVVDDLEDAMKFPSTNVYNTTGFGTPKQWLDFFNGEPELSDWKFHLVKVRN